MVHEICHYEYSPFGETIVATGELALENKFRFSTKYFDDETGLSYYGYRYYSPSLGRFVNKDPIGESSGAINLSAFPLSTVNEVEYLGLALVKFSSSSVESMVLAPKPMGDSRKTRRLGLTDPPSWPRGIAQVRGNFATFVLGSCWFGVEISGSLGLKIYYNSDQVTDPSKVVGEGGLTVTEHERFHAKLYADAWNALADEVNVMEKKYCPHSCAKKHAELVDEIGSLRRTESEIANLKFDKLQTILLEQEVNRQESVIEKIRVEISTMGCRSK